MKKLLSIGLVISIVLTLLPVALAQTITAPGVVDLTSYTASVELAQKQEGYARTYYILTAEMVTLSAILEYEGIYHPTTDITVLQVYYDTLLKLRTDMTVNSDFNKILQQMKTAQQKASTTLIQVVTGNYTEKPEIKGYIYAYRDADSEDDDAYTAWGTARAETVYAQEALTVADLSNSIALAEYYTPSETTNIASMETYISEIKSLSDSLAIAAENFDEVQVSSLSLEVQTTTSEAKSLAAVMWDKVFAAYRELNGP